MTEKIYYTNAEFVSGLSIIVDKLRNDNWIPEVIIGILRGGIIPAVYFSHAFNDLSLISVEWSIRDNIVGKYVPPELEGYLFSNSRMLVVDDICDSGATLVELFDEFKSIYRNEKLIEPINLNVRAAVMHYNEGQDNFIPNYYHHKINKNITPTWIVYPWENMN